ncbi:hypothetical protein J2X69_003169 [Algoriphagus sp. 4150]|uniref:cytochrome C n=1 Tax=Algoriphagus sp. 4150 TaxID=2817756 RepID=UPI00285EA7F3|nr:cytochrome C [Algoriphagus sp. 4150]MDR7130810.1 hypothetical protein [Algoriphagus sp. 4150]
MRNIPNPKEQSAQTEKKRLFDGLVKSVLGIVVILFLLLGLIVFLIFQPDLSALRSSDSAELSASLSANQPDPTEEIIDGKDVETGLVAGEGLEMVKANCTNCHSSALILQNRFTREGWHEKIEWMQETQGLWDLGSAESIILDYLAAHYAPEAPQGRRIPLSGIEWYELKD